MEIVDHHHVHAAIERPFVRPDVGLERSIRVQRPIRTLDRDVDLSERGHRLRLAVLENLKIVLLQILDEIAVPVGDHDVDLDVVNAQLERRLLRLRSVLIRSEAGRREGENGAERG